MNDHNCPVCSGSLSHLSGLIFNAEQHLIIFNSKAKRLSLRGTIIFSELYRRFGRPVKTERLIYLVWDADEPEKSTSAIGVEVCRLRSLLTGSGYYIPRAQYASGYESGSYTLYLDQSKKEAALR